MELDYIAACGVVWRKTLDPVAGSELIQGLKSEDEEIRFLAQVILAESGEASMGLLESAVSSGSVNPESAGPCMVSIMRLHNRIGGWATCERDQN